MQLEIKYPYLFKLDPTPQQDSKLRTVAGACRWLYNYFLNSDNQRYQDDLSYQNYNEHYRLIKALQRFNPWLKEVDSQVLQQKMMDLDQGWSRFFQHTSKHPTFKKKSKKNDSIRYPQRFKFKSNQVYLPRIGWVKFHKSREIQGIVRSVTVKQDRKGWHVSVLTKQTIEVTPQGYNPIGIDLGLTNPVTLSDGTVFDHPKPFKKYLKKLIREQRRLSGMVKGSRNRRKQARKVGRVYERMTRTRNDWQQKTSTIIAKSHSLVCVEDLAVANMVKNRKLAKAISDMGWSGLVRMLGYKTEWYGSKLVKVGRWFPSSKTCSRCGTINRNLTLKDRIYTCDCNQINKTEPLDRDHNAAINILTEGIRLSTTGGQPGSQACGDLVSPGPIRVRRGSRKQEPPRKPRSRILANLTS